MLSTCKGTRASSLLVCLAKCVRFLAPLSLVHDREHELERVRAYLSRPLAVLGVPSLLHSTGHDQSIVGAQVLRRLAGLALSGAQHTALKTPPRLRNGRNGLLRKRKGKDSLDGPPGGAATPAGPLAALLALGGGLFAAVAWAGLPETSQSLSLSPRLRVVVVEGTYGCARAVREVSAGALGGGALSPKAPPNGVRVAGGGAAPDPATGVQAVVLGGGDGALALMANGAVLVAHVEVRILCEAHNHALSCGPSEMHVFKQE